MIANAKFCALSYHGSMAKSTLPAVDKRRKNIMAWRDRRGLSNYAMAKAAGMSEGTLRAALEEAKTTLSIPKLEMIASALGASVEEIISAEPESDLMADYWALDEGTRAHLRETARMLAAPFRIPPQKDESAARRRRIALSGEPLLTGAQALNGQKKGAGRE